MVAECIWYDEYRNLIVDHDGQVVLILTTSSN